MHSLFTCFALLIAATPGFAATVVDDAALADDSDGKHWLSYGRTYSETRYSPLDAINTETVPRLGISWYLDLPNDRTLTSTPLAVDGVLYFTGSYSVTRAVDARTGKILWEYDPESIAHGGDKLRIMWDTSRGLAYWKGHVIIATIDGRLVSLNAKTGERVWETVTVPEDKAYYITGAPKVFRDKVIIGNGGTEQEAARGYVVAYDVATGEEAWRFYVVPGNPADGFENEAMEMAAKTWTGSWWEFGGGGNVWNGITYDPEFNQIIMGTGNGSPWNRKIRSPGGGDNLFLCSLVAVDADTGAYKWHYQTVPGETWDYNSNMDISLTEITIGGEAKKVLLHAPKNGFFYVIDRQNGSLLSAEKIGKATWASHIDMETGRPVEVEGSRYEDGEELVWPSPFGVHSWHAMSYSPKTGLAYIPTIEMPAVFTDKGIDLKAWRSPKYRLRAGVAFGTEDSDPETGLAKLLAWDPVKQERAWEVALPKNWNPGTMATAGNLVFQGRASGDFVAYDARSGEELWSTHLGLGISAPPITYEVDGVQYVSLLVGWGGAGLNTGSLAAQHGWAYKKHPRRLFTFSLDGDVSPPPSPPPYFPKPVDVEDLVIDTELAAVGQQAYAEACLWCHGGATVSGGNGPDLREAPTALALDTFREVVLKGRIPLGMPAFHDYQEREIAGLFHYIRQQARKSVAAGVHAAAAERAAP